MDNRNTLRRQNIIRYIEPLREGGSLPALAEADDGFRYVVKFRGGGHGSKAVISELIGGEIARAAGLRVPELVFLNLDESFGRTEPDEEIQDLLHASTGLNLGLHYLGGSMTWDVAVNRTDPVTASRIVWLDAFLTNVDRTARNTNMLLWDGFMAHRPRFVALLSPQLDRMGKSGTVAVSLRKGSRASASGLKALRGR